jgi:hypothetical protein
VLTFTASAAVAVPGVFIGVSILMAPGDEEITLQQQVWEAAKRCKEEVLASYGLNP